MIENIGRKLQFLRARRHDAQRRHIVEIRWGPPLGIDAKNRKPTGVEEAALTQDSADAHIVQRRRSPPNGIQDCYDDQDPVGVQHLKGGIAISYLRGKLRKWSSAKAKNASG